MREILFRGYSREDEKWYYGFVHNSVGCLNGKQSEHYFIRPIEKIDNILEDTISYEIDKDSIGQYTGFKDKKGVEIYEGDIMSNQTTYYIIKFDKGCWVAEDRNSLEELLLFAMCNVKVIGNIYEEKLKEDK